MMKRRLGMAASVALAAIVCASCECDPGQRPVECTPLTLDERVEGAFEVSERVALELPEGASRESMEGVWDCHRVELEEGGDYRLEVSTTAEATVIAIDPEGRSLQDLVLGGHDEAIGGDERVAEDVRTTRVIGLRDGAHAVLVFFLGPPVETLAYHVRLARAH